jgi:hypothetical protein
MVMSVGLGMLAAVSGGISLHLGKVPQFRRFPDARDITGAREVNQEEPRRQTDGTCRGVDDSPRRGRRTEIGELQRCNPLIALVL